MAIEVLEDEVKGIEEYKEMLQYIECPELRKIFTEALMDEKKHVNAILRWINTRTQKVLA